MLTQISNQGTVTKNARKISSKMDEVNAICFTSESSNSRGLTCKISIAGKEIIPEGVEIALFESNSDLSFRQVFLPVDIKDAGNKNVELRFESENVPSQPYNVRLYFMKLEKDKT